MLAWLKGCLQNLTVRMARVLNRFLAWTFASRNPTVVLLRETIRKNRVLIMAARAFIRSVRALPMLPQLIQDRFKPMSVRRLQSIMVARAAGGSLTASELEQIWRLAKRRGHALVIAQGVEREQIELVLKAVPMHTTCCEDARWDRNPDIDKFDLIVAGPDLCLKPGIEHLKKRARTLEKVLKVGETGTRSVYSVCSASRTVGATGIAERESRPMQERIARGDPLRVVFLNDVGFQYGAGVALKRQVASLLLKGWEVSVVAWLPGDLVDPPVVTGVKHFAGWRGVHNVGKNYRYTVGDRSQAVADILSRISALDPDLIITGNLHGTGFPLELATGLKAIDTPVVSYMHDCFWVTGRCAYPVSCQLYRTGCDETCPTADEYPTLQRNNIRPAWLAKAEIFAGGQPVPLVTNSAWTRDTARARYGDRARIDCVRLAVDHELFAPIPKAVARRLLGLPTEGVFVVMGAVDILNKWKGGNLFRGIHDRLQGRSDVSLLLFGQSSDLMKSTRSFGMIGDERLMPIVLNCADIFVGTATEEAFGQTLLEAAACGVPVVAFDRGGISDVVIDGTTGLLVKNVDVGELQAAIDRLLADRSLRELLGKNARKRVESHFTLMRQADAWIDYLKNLH